jgi:hypothetical protein
VFIFFLTVFFIDSCNKSRQIEGQKTLQVDSTYVVDFGDGAPAENGSGSDSGPYLEDTVYSSERPSAPQGKISYSVPDTMDFNRDYLAILRISKNESDSTMTVSSGFRVDDKFVLIENVRVSTTMSAELVDLSTEGNFSIKELSTKEQNIEQLGFTEWQWVVRPNRGGYHALRIVVKVVEHSDYGSRVKDIPILERDVYVKAKPVISAMIFLKDYWQWIVAVVLIPLIKYWWDQRKEKTNK